MTKNTIPVHVGGRTTSALIDSGASVTIINKEFFKKTHYASHQLSPPAFQSVKGASGKLLPVLGQIQLEITINGKEYSFKTHVVDGIHHAFILGVDFLCAHDTVLRFSASNTLHIPDQYGENNVCVITTENGYARTKCPVSIPKRCEMNVLVHISRHQNGEIVLLEPHVELESFNISAARCCVQVNHSSAYFRIINPTFETVELPTNFVVAQVVDIDQDNILSLEGESREVSALNPDNSKTTSQNQVQFDLGNSDLDQNQKEILLKFLSRYRENFALDLSELGCTKAHKHKIEIKPNSKPVRLQFYRTSPQASKEIENQVSEMLKHDIIQPSNSEWHSPVVLVKKKNGQFRFACDYRALNKITVPMSFPLPHLETVFDAIGEAKANYFTNLDLMSGFWQMELDEDSRQKAAFITQGGVYEWKRMPFGLTNSPISFQTLMSNVLRGLNWKSVLVYVDDILIFSRSFDEHLTHLAQVFDRLNEANLKLQPAKCHFAVKEVKFLGHIISRQGVRVDSEKTAAVSEFPTPKTQKQVRSFLGMANYYRRFVQDFAKIATPLNSLLNKDKKFEWNIQCQSAFETLKEKLISAPILAYPDTSKSFILTCDASDSAVGYVLGQIDDENREYVICYGGKSLSTDQKKFNTTEKECLAVLEGIAAFRPYLVHSRFTVVTDHKALVWLQTAKHTGRLERWALKLQEYNFQIVHRPGKSNLVADALSRRDYPKEVSTTEINSVQTQTSQDVATQCSTTTTDPQTLYKCAATQTCSQGVETNNQETDTKVSTQDNSTTTIAMVAIQTGEIAEQEKVVSEEDNTTSEVMAVVSDLTTSESESKISETEATTDDETSIEDNCCIQVSFSYQSDSPMVAPVQDVQNDDTQADVQADQQNIGELQRNCPDFQQVYEYLLDGTLPAESNAQDLIISEAKHFSLVEGILYHWFQRRCKKPKGEFNFVKQVALPRVLRKDALLSYHDSLAGGGHLGIEKVKTALYRKYYWPRMHSDIVEYVKSCDRCQHAKRDFNPAKPPMQALPPAKKFERWHIDILGPLYKTKEGNEYILLCVDAYSRWVEGFPLKTQSAEETARVLFKEIFSRYGAPKVLFSDRGRNFMSKLVNALCEIFDITQHHTSAYHPKTNGLVERQNSTLAQSLRAHCGNAQEKWPDLISSILMAYRKSPSMHSTEFSPFLLLFGEEMNLPYDVALDPLESMAKDAKAYIREFLANMRVFDKIAKENIEWHQTQNKIRHDKNSNIPNFQQGDQVLIKVNKVPKGLSSKLYDKADGPYRIVDVGPNFTYKLRRCSDNKLHGSMMNASNLKLYHDPEVMRPNFEVPETQSQNQGQTQDQNQSQTQGQIQGQIQGQNQGQIDGQVQVQPQQEVVSDDDTDTVQDLHLDQFFDNQQTDESMDSGQSSDGEYDEVDASHEIYDPQKKWKFKKFLRGRFKNGRREIYIEWDDGSKTWEPDQCFDGEVLDMINRKFTKLGTIRKSCFKRNY